MKPRVAVQRQRDNVYVLAHEVRVISVEGAIRNGPQMRDERVLGGGHSCFVNNDIDQVSGDKGLSPKEFYIE